MKVQLITQKQMNEAYGQELSKGKCYIGIKTVNGVHIPYILETGVAIANITSVTVQQDIESCGTFTVSGEVYKPDESDKKESDEMSFEERQAWMLR